MFKKVWEYNFSHNFENKRPKNIFRHENNKK